jgi:hypothetical protein
VATGLAEVTCAVLHLPKRELAEWYQQSVLYGVAKAKHGSAPGGVSATGTRLRDDHNRIEPVLVGARAPTGIASPET